jgi:hypothetical protein
MKSLHHSFDIDMAAIYGVNPSIIIHHFQHWIRINKKLKRNFHEGRTWSYQTLDEIAAHFPYFSKDEIYEIINLLCSGKGRRSKQEKGFDPVLIKGNFNKSKFDRTTWYAFKNEEMFTVMAEAKIKDGSSQNPNGFEPGPIPDTKPDSKTNPPPLTPPKSDKPEVVFSAEEEEEIQKRLKERPTEAVKIKNFKRWKEAVVFQIRNEKTFQTVVDESLVEAHKKEASFYDGEKIDDWLIRTESDRVAFSLGSHYFEVLYNVNDSEWRKKVKWRKD